MTENTAMIVSNSPISPQEHIFCIDSVMMNQPGKKSMFRGTLAFPKPTSTLVSVQVIKSMFINFASSK
jgi:hypothetical protein